MYMGMEIIAELLKTRGLCCLPHPCRFVSGPTNTAKAMGYAAAQESKELTNDADPAFRFATLSKGFSCSTQSTLRVGRNSFGNSAAA